MEITYKKGNRVTIKDGSSTKMATVVADGLDSQKRVRVRVDGFLWDMSITTNQSSNVYVIEKMANGSTLKGGGVGKDKLELFYVMDNNGNVKNISKSYEKANDFLEKSLKFNGKIGYKNVLKSDWDSEKINTSNIKKYAKGSTVKGDIVYTNKEVYDNGEVVDSWASDIGGSNESQDNIVEYKGDKYLVSINVEDNEVIRPKAKALIYEQEYAKGSTVGGKKYQYYILQTKDGKVNWVVPKKIATIEEIVENAKKYNINIFASNFGTWESKRENGNRYTTEIVNEDGSDFKTDKEYNEISRAIGVVKKVKYGNGGGVAISSESGLAVGTNADLLMNQQNLQYGSGGAIKSADEGTGSTELREMAQVKIDKGMTVIDFSYTDYGGSFGDKVAIAYFKKHYPKNILLENSGYNGQNAFVFGKVADEYLEETKNYPLGFEDMEEFYFNMQMRMEEVEFKSFVKQLKSDGYKVSPNTFDWLIENKGGYYHIEPNMVDYSPEDLTEELIEEGLVSKKFGNGGGVAVSSESGLAVGTNADLMMNQNNLQYRKGGAIPSDFHEGDREMMKSFSKKGKYQVKGWEDKKHFIDGNAVDFMRFNNLEEAEYWAQELLNENTFQWYATEVYDTKDGETIFHSEQFGNGGNMSSGYNYSIGGL